MATPLDVGIQQFLDHLKVERELSVATLEAYGRDLVGFTFRYIIAAPGPSGEEDAATEGELRAIEWLQRAGWPYKRLSTVTAPVPEPRRRS